MSGIFIKEIMTSDRIKEIHLGTGYPESKSVHQALMQVWNECARDFRWKDPSAEKPQPNKQLLFKLKNNDRRFGVFLEKDQFDRDNMFCDGSFHKIESVKGWMYVPD